MFRFVKPIFVSTMMFFGCNLSSLNSVECVSMNNQECRVRREIVNANSKEPVFYTFTIKASKCSGSCNNINDPYAKLCVPDVVKSKNIKVFNLMSRTYETRHVKWHETCKCKCRLDASVCNSEQRGNKNKCRRGCKELIEKGICDKWFKWNLSNSECECDNSCDVGEYLDYANCKCRKRLVNKLVEKCTENIDQVKIAGMALFERRSSCKSSCKSSCTICVVLIATYFIYYKYNKKTASKYDYVYQHKIIKINGKYQRNKH